MARSFQACHAALRSDGRLVVVFANKQPDAWETLVGAASNPGRIRSRRFLADSDGNGQPQPGNRLISLSFICLAGLPKAATCPTRVG